MRGRVEGRGGGGGKSRGLNLGFFPLPSNPPFYKSRLATVEVNAAAAATNGVATSSLLCLGVSPTAEWEGGREGGATMTLSEEGGGEHKLETPLRPLFPSQFRLFPPHVRNRSIEAGCSLRAP